MGRSRFPRGPVSELLHTIPLCRVACHLGLKRAWTSSTPSAGWVAARPGGGSSARYAAGTIAGAMTFAANTAETPTARRQSQGTLVGARIGFNAIPDRFVDRLELVDVILELADGDTTDTQCAIGAHAVVLGTQEATSWRYVAQAHPETRRPEAGQPD